MWSKRVDKKDEKKVVTSTQTVFTTQTSYSSSSRMHRNFSESFSYAGTAQSPSASLSRLDNNYLGIPMPKTSRSSSVSNMGGAIKLDARPITTVNLNYQSPYRNSAVYSSFQAPKAQTAVTNLRRPVPSLEQSTTDAQASKKKLTVKKTGKFYDEGSAVPTYQTHSKKRGEVLIINNIMFEDKGYRQGAKVDHARLEKMFKEMGFRVTVERDLKKSTMESKVKSFSKRSSLFSADISIVIVMSHGTRNETLGGTEVFGIDEKGILVEDLLHNFTEANCKAMVGKPKIFIFQCCRGDNEQFVQSDSTRTPAVESVLADALIAYSTLPGFVSHRDPVHGTWYITTLCEVFSEHAHEYPVEDLLKIVDVKLSSYTKATRQTTHYESRGFKKCFLHPQ
jgi:hypothetical protein